MRFLFYSHDGFGLGHTRRNLALAAAVADSSPEASIIVATGSNEVEELGLPPRADVLRLPALRKLGRDGYGARRLPLRGSEIRGLRAAALKATVESFRPSVLIADKHPLGVRGELRPALETLRRAGGRAALGMRDVLDDPATARREWAADGLAIEIEQYYDRILVYGSEHVLDFVTEYGLSPALRKRTRFCGYVLHPSAQGAASTGDRPSLPFTRRAGDASRPAGARPRPIVLATVGAGEDGHATLRAFIEAGAEASWDPIIVCGPRCSSTEKEAISRLGAEMQIPTQCFVPNLSSWFAQVDALVCKGGYNTLTEALAAGTPTVCVPRVQPRSEQLIRARAFARRGLVRVIEPRELEPARLRREVDAALAGPSRAVLAERARARLGLGGARAAARELLELAESSSAVPVAAA